MEKYQHQKMVAAWCWAKNSHQAQHTEVARRYKNGKGHRQRGLCEAGYCQTCTNTRNTSIPPGVLSFQVVFVNKFNPMEYIFLWLLWLVSKGLDLISSRYM